MPIWVLQSSTSPSRKRDELLDSKVPNHQVLNSYSPDECFHQSPIALPSEISNAAVVRTLEDSPIHFDKSSNIKEWKSLEEELICPICQEIMAMAHTIDCGHSFCGSCIYKWMKHKQPHECPTCRASMISIVPSHALDKTIEIASTHILSKTNLIDLRNRCKAWENIHDRKHYKMQKTRPESDQEDVSSSESDVDSDDNDQTSYSNWIRSGRQQIVPRPNFSSTSSTSSYLPFLSYRDNQLNDLSTDEEIEDESNSSESEENMDTEDDDFDNQDEELDADDEELDEDEEELDEEDEELDEVEEIEEDQDLDEELEDALEGESDLEDQIERYERMAYAYPERANSSLNRTTRTHMTARSNTASYGMLSRSWMSTQSPVPFAERLRQRVVSAQSRAHMNRSTSSRAQGIESRILRSFPSLRQNIISARRPRYQRRRSSRSTVVEIIDEDYL